MQNQFSWSRKL